MAQDEDTPGYEGQVSCEHCHRRIPRSEVFQPEGSEYTLYFCGLDCYAAWRRSGGSRGDD